MRTYVGLSVAVVLALGAACTGASAQEAPVCLTAKEKLKDAPETYRGRSGRDSVTGLRGKDKLFGRGGNDFLNGGRDNDVVKGGPGDDLLCGGRGGDKIIGGPGNDLIYGEEENDRIIPGPGRDRVLGSAGNDRIFGWGREGGQIVDDGVDILNGGFNDDVIEAGGADSLDGYTHADVLTTRTPSVAPEVMDGGGNDDTIYGSDQPDLLIGNEGTDLIFGGLGDDRILGAGNDDKLFGQLGDDRLDGGKGFDHLDGGDGGDVCDGGANDLPKDTFDDSCEQVQHKPKLAARRDGGAKSRIKITKLRTSGAMGRVMSGRSSCAGSGRKVSLFAFDGFVSDKVAITYTDGDGHWKVRRDLKSDRYFAKVDASSGCRYAVSGNKRL